MIIIIIPALKKLLKITKLFCYAFSCKQKYDIFLRAKLNYFIYSKFMSLSLDT